MELHALKCFYQANALGNMTRASESLRLSQPALSIAVKKLEQELGVDLFVRNGKKIALSERGAAILPYVEKMLFYEREIHAVCKTAASKERLVIHARAASPAIAQILPAFYKSHQNTEIELIQGGLPAGEPDMIISASPEAAPSEEAAVVLEERILLAVPCGHPLSARKSVRLSELKQYSILGLKRGSVMREIENQYCEREKTTISYGVECDSPATLRALIERGGGIAFIPAKTWPFQTQSAFRRIPLADTNWTRYITLEKTHARSNDQLVQLFYESAAAFFSAL